MGDSRADKPILLLASRSPRRREILDAAGLAHIARHPGIDDSVLNVSPPGGASPFASGCSPEHHVIGLAYLKAVHAIRAGVFTPDELARASWVLGCDTTIVIERAGTLGERPEEPPSHHAPQDQPTPSPLPLGGGSQTKTVELLGTPTDRDDARRILTTLLESAAHDEPDNVSNSREPWRGHRVVTGVALVTPYPRARIPVAIYARAVEKPPPWRVLFADSARVRLGPISPTHLEEYLDSGLWQGKAGGYNLAERQAASWPVQYDGDPTTIMGLPIVKLQRVLASLARTGGDSVGAGRCLV